MRPKKKPAETDEMKKENDGTGRPEPFGETRGEGSRDNMINPVSRQKHPVISAPGDKVPGRSMPEPAQDHGEHEIEVRTDASFLISSERDIEVIPQPGRKTDVPAAPEFTWVPG